MYAKALRSFDSKPLKQHIRQGTTFHCEPGYGNDLKRNGLIEILDAMEEAMGPSSNKHIPGAPQGKGPAPATPKGPAQDKDGGQGPKSPSSPAAPASPVKTVTSSSIGEKRTSRKKKTVLVGRKTPAATSIPAK